MYLIRHGETDSNRDHRLQGHADIPLNERGRWQAARLRRALWALTPDRVYSSDLARCVETARIAMDLPDRAGLAFETFAELRERSYGAWEGLTAAEVESGYPDLYHAWRYARIDFCPPGGETYAASSARIVRFIQQEVDRCPGRRIVLVSHGGVIRSALIHALGLQPHAPVDLILDNASISAVRVESRRWSVAVLNDTCHLEPQPPSCGL